MVRKLRPVADTNIVMLKYIDTEPGHAPEGATSLMQGWKYAATEPLLDGPISRRVAVLDLDPDTGILIKGARFVPPKGRSFGYYEIESELDAELPDFMQVSVFGAVMRMMSIFEAPDVLGRQIRWAFDGEQLLVVPRAGKMPNAFYHRDSRSLQFFFVYDPTRDGKFVYTCLSPDIVAHETTHAILDGIAPDLYNATSPQSLAMHEAIADLGAVMLAVRTGKLRDQVMKSTGGDITKPGAFNEIARQFGGAVSGEDRPLRDLNNKASMTEPGKLNLNEPHELSMILTGALYSMLVSEYEQIGLETYERELATAEAKRKESEEPALTDLEKAELRFSVCGGALFAASEKFKRIAFRALDYLPPGEISFADYGRAMIAADHYSNPDDPEPREFIKAEFKRRGMVEDIVTLDPVAPDLTLPAGFDLEQLARSDWAAYQFAETWRKQLLIPANTPFEVRPRLEVTRKTWRKGNKTAMTRALFFKVAWQTSQAFQFGEFVREVAVARGTTVAIDWDTRTVSTLLSTSPQHPSQGDHSTSVNDGMRTAFLAANIDEGLLEFTSPDVQVQNGVLRVRAMGQTLHMLGH